MRTTTENFATLFVTELYLISSFINKNAPCDTKHSKKEIIM